MNQLPYLLPWVRIALLLPILAAGWRGLSHVARELTAGPVASDEVGQIIEQHGARIGRLGDGVNVDNR